MKAAQGSFVNAEQLAKMSKKAPVEEPKAPEPPVAEEKSKDEPDAAAEFKRVKADNEKAIGVVITEEDINDYIFRGRIIKKDVQAIKGKVSVTFQSLTPKELEAVDKFVAAVSSTSQHTAEGVANLRTIEQLCYAWLEINGKQLPKDTEKKKEAINNMGTHVINRVVDAFRCFDVLIAMNLREEEFLKK